MNYRGRFAPSPTGALHLGSLIAAVASFIDARAHAGQWLLRIEDIDQPRSVPGAADRIRQTLTDHALEWDAEVPAQSTRLARYRTALGQLSRRDLTFPCDCSRKALSNAAIYPGTCRGRQRIDGPHAVRVRVPNERFEFDDRIQGHFGQQLNRGVGDFVVQRRDGLFAYQLAVVVDDAEQGISDVVRGADLLDNTPRQLFLMQALGYARPRYAHIPVLTGKDGEKLSKQNGARAVDDRTPGANLLLALELLGQSPPPALRHAPPRSVIDWARSAWRIDRVPHGPVLTNYQGLC